MIDIGKKINKLTLAKEINEKIELLNTKQKIFDMVLPVLKSFEGKQVSKRIESKMIESFPQLSIGYYTGELSIDLKIWGNGLKYDDRIEFKLCNPSENKTFKCDYTLGIKNWYAYKEHIDELKTFKKNMVTYVNKWNELIDYIAEKEKEFKDIPYPASNHFYIRNLFY